MTNLRLAVFNTQPPHLYFGGVERRIVETTRRLKNEVNVTVYSGTKQGFKKPTTIEGVNFVPCYSTDKIFPLDNWFFNRSLIRVADSIEADVYEGHAVSGYGFPQALKKRSINRPFIHTIHGVLADEYEQAKNSGYASFRGRIANYFMHRLAMLEKKTAMDATLIVTISNYSLEKIREYYHVDASKVRIVPNGVDIERFKPMTDQLEAKQQFGLGAEPCVLFVGSLIPRKGLPYLIKAAKSVVEKQSDVKFIIVGEGPLKEQLTNSINTANISKNFLFISKVKEEQLPIVYNCADVFVLPSIQEGQGIVLLEAQSSGKPVVAFDIGGVNEAVRNEKTGLLVKPGSSQALADSLFMLIEDQALREKMGRNGREFVAENYTWDLCARKMLNVYNEAINVKL